MEVTCRYATGLHVAAALPLRAREDGWLLAAGSGFGHLAADGTVRILAEPEAAQRGVVRMNDAKCDPAGRLWAGSMGYDERPGAGSLFRVDLDGSVTRVLRDRQISNGIDWSPDARTMYYADSGHGSSTRRRMTSTRASSGSCGCWSSQATARASPTG